ncbi:hypothetical protein [Parerythrobacter aestuarii]|uniref:hypothetical protein n=1 Tax=Parerythrobacter aestuarii TaxID=3020909 RepID=UPI0024DE1176|nr:hypothetical protein [Parerythrobacter aestuarii]
MPSFTIHLMGRAVPLTVDLDCADIEELAQAVGQSRFVLGNLTEPDEDGVYRRVMIAFNRIECVVEAA